MTWCHDSSPGLRVTCAIIGSVSKSIVIDIKIALTFKIYVTFDLIWIYHFSDYDEYVGEVKRQYGRDVEKQLCFAKNVLLGL